MKKTKSLGVTALIMLIFIMSTSSIFSYEDREIPKHIKIGLFFANTAKTSLLLESETGFEINTFYEDKFNKIFDLDEDEILLEKDKSNSYYIQIGSDFRDYLNAKDFLEELNTYDIESYLSFDKKWKVVSGPFSSKLDANKEADKINLHSNYEIKIIDSSNTRVQVLNKKGNIIFIYDSNNEMYFSGQDFKGQVPLVNVEGSYYRGGITAKRLSNSDMTIINTLPLEEYLYGVVPGEMPATWPLEALKAQAVAARGFALSNLNKYREFGFNLCTTVNSQVYKGYSTEHVNTNKAVDETKDIVIKYKGQIIEPYYHSSSGGQTENSENVWSASLPYIKGIKDEFSLDSPHSNWSVVFTNDEIKTALENHNIYIGDILDIEVTSLSKNNRILSLTIYGTKGKEVLEKQRSRTILGLKSNYFSIDSNTTSNNINKPKLAAISGSSSETKNIDLNNKYVITADGMDKIKKTNKIQVLSKEGYRTIEEKVEKTPLDSFTINGKGYGHGLGMSQYGAKNMSELGYKYDEILTHYYTDVEVE